MTIFIMPPFSCQGINWAEEMRGLTAQIPTMIESVMMAERASVRNNGFG
jgi:hypothetical protein